MTTPDEFRRMMEQIARQWSDFGRRIVEAAGPVFQAQEVLRQASEALERLSAPAQSALETLSRSVALQVSQSLVRLVRTFEELREVEREALELLTPRGWLISPSLSAGALREILGALKEHGIDAMERELIELFDAEFCERILEKCFERPSFQEWEPKLRRALAAHRRSEYDLAIPIWLIAIEGILSRELTTPEYRIDDVYTRVQGKKGSKRLRQAFYPANEWLHPLLDGMLAVLREFGRSIDNQDSPNPVLRRHGIMHGEDPHFGVERDSIQCILMLEVINLYLGFRDSDDEQTDSGES